MPEGDEIGRSLALARSALGPPPAVRARVRARLTAGGPASAASSRDDRSPRAAAAPSGARALVRAITWTSLGLCAGYWLGLHRIGANLVEHAPVTQDPPAQVMSVATAPAGSSGARSSKATSVAAPPAPADAASATTPPSVGSPLDEGADDGERATDGSTAAPAVAASAGTAASARSRTPSRASPPRRHAGAAARAPRSESTLAAEIALLERTERAIRAGEGQLALVLIEQLEREFPTSSLHQERAAARVLARCTEARSAGPAERVAARARAEQFLADGSSVYADRVRQLCALDEQN